MSCFHVRTDTTRNRHPWVRTLATVLVLPILVVRVLAAGYRCTTLRIGDLIWRDRTPIRAVRRLLQHLAEKAIEQQDVLGLPAPGTFAAGSGEHLGILQVTSPEAEEAGVTIANPGGPQDQIGLEPNVLGRRGAAGGDHGLRPGDGVQRGPRLGRGTGVLPGRGHAGVTYGSSRSSSNRARDRSSQSSRAGNGATSLTASSSPAPASSVTVSGVSVPPGWGMHAIPG